MLLIIYPVGASQARAS